MDSVFESKFRQVASDFLELDQAHAAELAAVVEICAQTVLLFGPDATPVEVAEAVRSINIYEELQVAYAAGSEKETDEGAVSEG